MSADLPIIAVDSDLMETIAHQYGLTIEFDGSHGYMQLDGIQYVAAIEAVA